MSLPRINWLLTLFLSQVVIYGVECTSKLPSAQISSSNFASHLTVRHEGESNDRDTPLSDTCLLDNFHYPHHCQGTFCSFVVAWRDAGESVMFNLTAKVDDSSMVWAAVGFLADRNMVDADAVLCYLKKGGANEVHLGIIRPDRPQIIKVRNDLNVEREAVRVHAVQVVGNTLYCSFSRKKVVADQSEHWKMLTQQWHILVAAGRLYESEEKNTTLMSTKFKKATSNCKCNVTACAEKCDCPDGFKYQLLKWHGVLMSLAFIFFIPTGAIISRYYKMVFVSSWFKAHLAMMLIGLLWSLVGFGMILGHTGGRFSVGIHQIVGITCLALVVLQPLVAFLRPPAQPTTVRRVLFVAFHRTMAVSIVATSCVALFMGIYIFCNMMMKWLMALLGVSILTNLGFVLLLEVLVRTHKFSTIPPVGYHKVTKNDDLSESEEEVFVRDDPNKVTKTRGGGARRDKNVFKIEKTLLLLYVIQAVIFSSLVISLLYYFDSHKHGD